MRFEESSNWGARVTVPDDEHAVVASIRRHNPVFVLTAKNARDLIAVTLKQFLLLCNVIVDDSCVSRGVEHLCPVLISEEVNTLIDVLIETIHLGQCLYTGQKGQKSYISVSEKTKQHKEPSARDTPGF